MNRKELIQMARRNLEHVKAGTVDQAPDVHRVPAAHYVDADRWQHEMDRIFRRVPLVLGFTAELRDVGSYRSMIVADVPILLTRGDDGVVRAFLNVCSHRGAVVVEEGLGKASRFTCPYHRWAFERGERYIAFSRISRSSLRVSSTGFPFIELAAAAFSINSGTSISLKP